MGAPTSRRKMWPQYTIARNHLADALRPKKGRSHPVWADVAVSGAPDPPGSAMNCFGEPPNTARLQPERRTAFNATQEAELDQVLEGYRVLDSKSGGKYGLFLGKAARCTRCAADQDIAAGKQPIPLMCGTAGLDGTAAASFVSGHRALQDYRRTDGSLCFNPERDGREELSTLLDQHGLKGLAIGHCGWGDLTARVRGPQLGDGINLMILGADWYPLTQCSNFLIDRHTEWDNTLRSFFSRLGIEAREQVPDFLRDHRVYLGNTLLCYRTGWEKKDRKNLSPRSFDNCRPHLRRHIEAVAPRTIVTLGKDPYRSVAILLSGDTDRDQIAIESLRMGKPLKDVMETFLADRPPRGIAAHMGPQAITFLPLCHPTYQHLNGYDGDYETLKALVVEAREHSRRSNPSRVHGLEP